jgi:hypothetical protein
MVYVSGQLHTTGNFNTGKRALETQWIEGLVTPKVSLSTDMYLVPGGIRTLIIQLVCSHYAD